MIDPRSPDYTAMPGSAGRSRREHRLLDPQPRPLLTIVTPLRNTPREVFSETMATVLAQTYQQWEWIAVDDGSERPEAAEIFSSTAERDPRLTLLRHDRPRGPGAARNTAVRAAATGLVFQIDGDDLLEPTCIEKELWCLLSRSACAVAGSFTVGFGARCYLWDHGFDCGARFLTENSTSNATILRKEAFDAVGGYDEAILDGFEDWDLWLKLAHAGMWGETVREYLVWYRRSNHAEKWASWDDGERMKRFRERLARRYPDLLLEFPRSLPAPAWAGRTEALLGEVAASNRLEPAVQAMVAVRSLRGGMRDYLALVEEWSARGHRVTIVTQSPEDEEHVPALSAHTPDVFVLPAFLPSSHEARFLGYLEASRRPEEIIDEIR